MSDTTTVVVQKSQDVTFVGTPWSLEGIFSSFESADAKRKSLDGVFVKVRRRSDGTFTVHSRSTPPGKAQAKPEKKMKRSFKA